ncbi:MAG: hypothetical protein IKO61_04440 [Lachnospiraceae bacterium]|nr:hypothetical protein [Lachnospiraceae bacterium]
MEKDNLVLEEYERLKPLYRILERVVNQQLTEATAKAGVGVMQIAHRLKERDSVSEKMRRKANKYTSITDMTDIIGFRIICYFSDQVNEAAKIIEELFNVDRENSIDKRKMLSPNTFGYLSLHYTCRLFPDASYDEELCNLPFEIQIRSVLQHTWAEIEHDLGYKSEFGVPYHIRREFSRIAGLLEIADEAFINIRNNIVNYVDDVRERIHHDKADELLVDINTLREFTKHSAVWQELMDRIISLSGAERIEASPEDFLKQLKQLGITTLGDLKSVVLREREHVLLLVGDALEYFEMDEISSNTVLYYLCQACLVWGDYTEEQAEAFYKASEKNEARRRSRVKKIRKLKDKYLNQ